MCLENRYSNVEPRTDTLVETEKTSTPSGKTAEQTNIEDNDKVSTKTDILESCYSMALRLTQSLRFNKKI